MEDGPDDGPEARLAYRIRSIRKDHGLSQRELAKKLGYAARSNLSEYENPDGRIATEQLLRLLAANFEDVELPELLALRRDAVRQKGGLAQSTDVSIENCPDPDINADQSRPTAPSETTTTAAHYGRKRRWTLPAVAATSACLIAVLVVIWLRSAAHRPSLKIDEADPKVTGCATDGVTLTTAPVTPAGMPDQVLGHLMLRYSQHCHSVWPLFLPTSLTPSGATVHLVTRRPTDQATAPYDFPNASTSDDVYGNMLRTSQGCALVMVTILDVNGQSLATGRTDCIQD